MKLEHLSSSIASMADKLSDYHSRLMALERQVEQSKEVKDVKTKSGEERKQLSET